MDESERKKMLVCAVRAQLTVSELGVWVGLLCAADDAAQVDVAAASLAQALNMIPRTLRLGLAGCVQRSMLYQSIQRGRISCRLETDPAKWVGNNHSELVNQLGTTIPNWLINWEQPFRIDQTVKNEEVPGQTGPAPAPCAAKAASTTEFGQESIIISEKNTGKKKNSLVRTPSDEALRVAQVYHGRIRALYPNLTRRMDEKTDTQGALVLDDLVRLDGHDWEHVKSVLRWVLTDAFWSRNLMSLASARGKGNNGLTKFVNAAAKADLAKAMVESAAQDSRPWITVGRVVADDDAASVPNCIAWP